MLKILKKAESYSDGIGMPDLYRNINSIRSLARQEQMSVSECTLQLCKELEQLGRGKLTQKGKAYYFSVETQHTNTPSVKAQSAEEFWLCVEDRSQSTHQHSTTHYSDESPTTSTSSEFLSSGERGQVDRKGDAPLPGTGTECPPSEARPRESGMGDIPPATSTTPPEGARNGHRRDAGQNTTPIHPTAKKDEAGHTTSIEGNGTKPKQETQEQHPQSAQSNDPVLKVGDRVQVPTANGPETGVIEEINAEGFYRCSGEGFFAWFGPSEISLIE